MTLRYRYDIAIPKDLKALHRWKNEQINTNYEAFVNNSTFFLLEEALDSLKVLLSGFKHN
ncbi:hypothetical protein [Sphingobacterium sp.]|uniref:hypothetical protein n=1 Tax=Sphingobacterium sp. TaxID=341027 RepID=UPI0031D64D82